MKKYRSIFILTYLGLALTGFMYKYSLEKVPIVSLISLSKEDIIHSITCSGTVNAEQYGVFSSVSTDIDEIYVSLGDKVNKNDKLVKTEITDEAVTVMAGIESYRNELYNNYISVLSQALNDLGISSFANDITMPALPEYDYVVQDSSVLYAPVQGTVTSVNTSGKAVELGVEPIIVITDYSNVSVVCKVSESMVNDIEIGQRVKITGNGFTKSYSGKVADISTNVNASIVSGGKATVDVIISVDNPSDELLNGLSASCKITTDTQRSASVLPASCIYQNENNEEFVMLYKDGAIEYKNVECEYYSAEKVKVSGVDEQDNVVISEKLLPESSKVIISEGD